MKISKELYTFFKEWLAWATSDNVVDTRNFSRDEGLCTALTNWASWYGHDVVLIHAEFLSLLENSFKGSYQFPFDKNLENYWVAKKKRAHHKNTKRLAFVGEQISKYETLPADQTTMK